MKHFLYWLLNMFISMTEVILIYNESISVYIHT